jgi:hypothetical protein
MSENSPFLILKQPCSDAITWVIQQISAAGMEVVRTFDLQDARHEHAGCTCPNHGTAECDCQMVVLLVYDNTRQPLTLIGHGHDAQTWLSVIDTPQQRAVPHLEEAVRRALSQNGFLSLSQTSISPAA